MRLHFYYNIFYALFCRPNIWIQTFHANVAAAVEALLLVFQEPIQVVVVIKVIARSTGRPWHTDGLRRGTEQLLVVMQQHSGVTLRAHLLFNNLFNKF
jgi:hypothetical protein